MGGWQFTKMAGQIRVNVFILSLKMRPTYKNGQELIAHHLRNSGSENMSARSKSMIEIACYSQLLPVSNVGYLCGLMHCYFVIRFPRAKHMQMVELLKGCSILLTAV
jgi:hypothetical protein